MAEEAEKKQPETQETTRPSERKPKLVKVVKKPEVVGEVDWSLVVEPKKKEEKKPETLPEHLREEATKEVLPVEVKPGQPIEIAAKGPIEKIQEALGLRKKKGRPEVQAIQ